MYYPILQSNYTVILGCLRRQPSAPDKASPVSNARVRACTCAGVFACRSALTPMPVRVNARMWVLPHARAHQRTAAGAIIYYTILYYTNLYCAILHYAILYYILHYTILCFTSRRSGS